MGLLSLLFNFYLVIKVHLLYLKILYEMGASVGGFIFQCLICRQQKS